MKIQLIVPPGGYTAERWVKSSSMPPLGLLYLGAVLEKEGHQVQIIPADILRLSWREVARKIRDFEPDIVGSSCITENRFLSFRLVRLSKKVFPLAITMLGGPHATMAAEDTLRNLPELDVVVRGEGEMTLREICSMGERAKILESLDRVKGISFRKDGRIQANPDRPPIQNLDSLPFPAFHLIPFEKYRFSLDVPERGRLPASNMITSRGCPFSCNFCVTPSFWGRRVRARSPSSVIAEIEHLVQECGVRAIFFCDDTFNSIPERAAQICDLMIERRLNIFWKCDIHVNSVDRPLLEKMKKAGLFHLSFGLEAGSERVRSEVINKRIDLSAFERLIRWCEELSIIPNPFFILSHPTETREEAGETIRIIESYGGRIESSIALLHVYPGTALEKTARAKGVLPPGFSWSRKNHPVHTLPAVQGDVPLFVDKLTWLQIGGLLFRWSSTGARYSILEKLPRALAGIRTLRDVKTYTAILVGFGKMRIKKFFHKNI
ncbi:MAG: B12-binding domain-containing radical SAM protein [Candidatus Aminicenantales bacterium]